jgi:hypothetical protein
VLLMRRLEAFVSPKTWGSGIPCLIAKPPPHPPPNSNFLRPRSQFRCRLLSLSLLSDLSLFILRLIRIRS